MLNVRRQPVRGGETAEEESAPLHPLFFIEIVEQIAWYLPFEDLKRVRKVNRRWWKATTPVWAARSQMKLDDFHKLRDFLANTSVGKVKLPETIKNWTFEGETVPKLMSDEGVTEQDLMRRFWPSVENLKLSNWRKKRFRYEFYRDPNNPAQQPYRRVPYYIPSRLGSAYTTMDLLKVCVNLKELVIHYPLLPRMKGAYIGPRQSPQLNKLIRLKLYLDGKKWDHNLDQPDVDPVIQLANNITNSDRHALIPREVSGGNTFILRILDHSPNLTRIEINSGTVMTTKMEVWFLRHLMNPRVNLPKLIDYHCSIPLHTFICECFENKAWPLRALHLRSVPVQNNGVPIPARELHSMIASFQATLQHLELILLGTGDSTNFFPSGRKLTKLESIEIWGFNGDHSFLHEIRKLKKAVVGARTPERYLEIQSYFQDNPLPEYIQLELKTPEDFLLRLDQGPQSPFVH